MGKVDVTFESHYNDGMEAEVRRLEARLRATAAGHPDWANACTVCGCELHSVDTDTCDRCTMNREAP